MAAKVLAEKLNANGILNNTEFIASMVHHHHSGDPKVARVMPHQYDDEVMTEQAWRRRATEWDAADGGISSSRRRLEQQQSRLEQQQKLRSEAWEAEAWIMSAKQSAPSTPQTEASTPSPRKGTKIPPLYLETISSAFGSQADLYKLLNVDRHASDRDIRIAYFRRGRQVLTDKQQYQEASSAAVTIGGVSEQVKLRFQAVSMAYEILSIPEWRACYDKTGLGQDDAHIQYFDSRSIPNSPASVASESRQTGVRWNEEVEELVFDQDPSEFSLMGESDFGVCGEEKGRAPKEPKKRKKKKKKKKKVVVEGTDDLLEDHLNQLDEVADRDLFNDFLDDIEASIDGFLSLGSRNSKDSSSSSDSKEDMERMQRKSSETRKRSSLAPPQSQLTSTRSPRPVSPPPKDQSDSPAAPAATEELVGPHQERHQGGLSQMETSELFLPNFSREQERHQAGRSHKEPSGLDMPDITRESRTAGEKESKDVPPINNIVINPEDAEVQPPADIAFTPRSGKPSSTSTAGYVHTPSDDSISTISNNTFGTPKQSQLPSLSDQPKLERVPEAASPDDFDDAASNSIAEFPLDEDAVVPPTPSWLEVNDKTIDPLSGETRETNDAAGPLTSGSIYSTPQIGVKSDASTVATAEVNECNAWCADTVSTPASEATIPHSNLFPCGNLPRPATTGDRSPVPKRAESADFVSDFIFHLRNYVSRIADEVTAFGAAVADNPSSLWDSMLLSENDLDGFFGILTTEMEQSPELPLR